MKRLTTDTPQDNIETALNLFYIKDRETWVRGGGPGPEYKDISLYDFARMVTKALIPEVELSTDNDNLSMMMGEWMLDDPDTEEGVISLLYTAAWAYAEIRHRLKAYEDTGLTPEEIDRIVDAYGRGQTLRSETSLRLGLVREIKTDRLRELAQADEDGRLVVLPFAQGKSLIDKTDLERPKLLKNFRVAIAYDRCGIVFHKPFSVFSEDVRCGNIGLISKEAEKLLEGVSSDGTE